MPPMCAMRMPCARAATDFLDHFGCPDVVIANAGISVGTVASEREDLDDFRLVMDTNWFGTLTTFQPFLHLMRERAPGVGGWRGTLVGIASVAGVRGLPGGGACSASKSAVVKLLESLRLEQARHRIRVVTIAPGYIRTPMTAHNPYRMPFLMDADVFARKAIRRIAAGTRYRVIRGRWGWCGVDPARDAAVALRQAVRPCAAQAAQGRTAPAGETPDVGRRPRAGPRPGQWRGPHRLAGAVRDRVAVRSRPG